MPLAVDGIWTPEEAEAAFTAFGNLFLQITSAQRDFGAAEMFDGRGANRIRDYLIHLPQDDFLLVTSFLGALPSITEGLAFIAALELLRRHLEEA